jgi:hypothetical protein
MECFRNMTLTNSTTNSLTHLNEARNATGQNLTKNSSSKILFCKSRALFFRKMYRVLGEKGKHWGEIQRVQTTGRQLAQFMGKDCFADSPIAEDQLYDVEFTVAIMELTAVKTPARNLSRHIAVHE